MMPASPTICGATWVAFCGSPSVSNCLSVTWQFGLALLCWSIASLAPLQDVDAQGGVRHRSARRPWRWWCRPHRSPCRCPPGCTGVPPLRPPDLGALGVDLQLGLDRKRAAAAPHRTPRCPRPPPSRWPQHSSSWIRCLTSIHRPPTSGRQPRPTRRRRFASNVDARATSEDFVHRSQSGRADDADTRGTYPTDGAGHCICVPS